MHSFVSQGLLKLPLLGFDVNDASTASVSTDHVCRSHFDDQGSRFNACRKLGCPNVRR